MKWQTQEELKALANSVLAEIALWPNHPEKQAEILFRAIHKVRNDNYNYWCEMLNLKGGIDVVGMH